MKHVGFDSPRASVIVPLKSQRDDWLETCVRSALSQTVPCDVIVVTSHLTPTSNLEVLDHLRREDSALRLLRRAKGQRIAGAINTGLAEAACDRVGLLLTDDWLPSDAVEECLKRDADIVGTGMSVYAADGVEKLWDRLVYEQKAEAMATLEEKARYLRHFLLLRKVKVLAVGGVDDSIGLTGPDDYDLLWTMLEHGATTSIVEKCLYNYRDHTEERLTLRSRAKQVRDLEKILDKHGVAGTERERLIAIQAPWFGKPMHVALEELDATPDEV